MSWLRRLCCNWSVITTALIFTFGFLAGFSVRKEWLSHKAHFGKAPVLLNESSIVPTGVSHNPEISKWVLARYLDLPHVTQVAKSVLRGGQVASENFHRDMVELFIFVEGRGILVLDDVNHSVSKGSVAMVFPPTRHIIFNNETAPLVLYTIASVP